jgi:signal transduction histidine kinase
MKKEGKKNIEVLCGVSPPQPTKTTTVFPEGVHWAPLGSNATDVTNTVEWGIGAVVYLTLSLSDTGIGMRPVGIDKIFQRSQQANVMTQQTYGGSGLGLFISKELTERMADEIGVNPNVQHACETHTDFLHPS